MANERASTAIVTMGEQGAEPRALQHTHSEQAILTREGLKLAAEQRQLLREYVEQQMVDGTDYGVIPGTKKKTLLKPGAEKLIELFRCTPKYTLLKEKQDFDTGLFYYRFRCRLVQRDANVVLAEGYGSCNSRESRYRYRTAARKCPTCGKEAIIKGKEEFGGGWLCYGKKGGCGAKFRDGDPTIEGQEMGQIENPDIADQENTILKVAKKRSSVDAAIALARISDEFTQDVGDDAGSDQRQQHGAPATAPTSQPAKAKPSGKKLAVWEQVVVVATDYGFDCGAGNAMLWAYVRDVIGKKPSGEWTENDLVKIEAALAEKMAARGTVPPAAPQQPEEDIPF